MCLYILDYKRKAFINLDTIEMCHDNKYNQEQTQMFWRARIRFTHEAPKNNIFQTSWWQVEINQSNYRKCGNLPNCICKYGMAIVMIDKNARKMCFCLHAEQTRYVNVSLNNSGFKLGGREGRCRLRTCIANAIVSESVFQYGSWY